MSIEFLENAKFALPHTAKITENQQVRVALHASTCWPFCLRKAKTREKASGFTLSFPALKGEACRTSRSIRESQEQRSCPRKTALLPVPERDCRRGPTKPARYRVPLGRRQGSPEDCPPLPDRVSPAQIPPVPPLRKASPAPDRAFPCQKCSTRAGKTAPG